MKLNIVIVGAGGVGGRLLSEVARYCQYQPTLETQILLIDGDCYEVKNADRQAFSCMGKKAEVKVSECAGLFNRVSLTPVSEFLTPDNIDVLIDDSDGVNDLTIVFVCVDNHKTRRLIDEYAGKMQNVVVINGGNNLIDGNVQMCVRKDGKWLTATMSEIHDEVANPQDKSPHELHCEELAAVSEPQLPFANLMVTALMCTALYNVVQNLGSLDRLVEIGEAFFDMTQMSVVPYPRPVSD